MKRRSLDAGDLGVVFGVALIASFVLAALGIIR